MELVTTAHPEDSALDMALTAALLDAVADRSAPETVRVFCPGPTLAFGRQDGRRAGFEAARRAAVAHGRTPVIRLGGGHAAAYDPDCVLVEVIRRQEHAVGGLEERFVDMVDLLSRALSRLGVTLELGQLPGEYCPGRFSLHLPAGPKVAGVAQRVLPRASLTTAVVVVAGGDALRATLTDVYAALDLPLDMNAAGAVSDRHPHITGERVRHMILKHVADRYEALPAPARRDA